MGRTLLVDTTLIPCANKKEIITYVAGLRDEMTDHRAFPFGLVGSLMYHTPVVDIMKSPTTPMRYGIEFEVEFHRLSNDNDGDEWKSYQLYAGKIANYFLADEVYNRTGGVTSDMSLDRGWEIVLGPRSIESAILTINKVINHEFIKPYLRHGGNAALHVTVDPFDNAIDARVFHNIWSNDEFCKHHEATISRRPNKYCKHRLVDVIDKPMRADTLSKRDNACNVRNNGAMEVRVFQAVYDVECLYNQLKLVQRVDRAVRKGLHTVTDIINFTRGF